MNKEQSAKIWASTMRSNEQTVAYHSHVAGWEAKEAADEWEDRCRSAEAALKALVNMKQWKDRSGKDLIYTRQMPLAWAEANNHLAAYYEEYEKSKPLPAPQAAAPVWVKDKNPPVGWKGYVKYSNDDNGGFCHYNANGFSHSFVSEWLDESPRQVFTREHVASLEDKIAFLQGQVSGLESNLAAYRKAEDTKDNF